MDLRRGNWDSHLLQEDKVGWALRLESLRSEGIGYNLDSPPHF